MINDRRTVKQEMNEDSSGMTVNIQDECAKLDLTC
jgi:hypothetical protein